MTTVDDYANRSLQSHLTAVIGDLLDARGYQIEHHQNGTRLLPALEVTSPAGARVVIHVERVIA